MKIESDKKEEEEEEKEENDGERVCVWRREKKFIILTDQVDFPHFRCYYFLIVLLFSIVLLAI